MGVVLDTSAIIYLQDFRKFGEIFTTDSVIREVKNRTAVMKLSALNIKVMEPGKKSLNEVKKIAGKTGDLEKLSSTDLEVLALAKELNATIVSDDYNVQNVAKKIGIKFISVFSRGIKQLFVWKKYCPSCGKYSKDELKECPVCGARLKRIPRKKVELK
jgi:UPF0271 protein